MRKRYTYFVIVGTREQCDEEETAPSERYAGCNQQVLGRINGYIVPVLFLARTGYKMSR